jgi:hypothetical protein
MSGFRSDSGEPLILWSYCSASLVDWCATLSNGAMVLSSRFECHHALPKLQPPITQWRVKYPIRVLQQLTVSQCNALKNRDGNTWLKYTEGQRKHFKQGCTIPESQVAQATKYIMVVTNICRSSYGGTFKSPCWCLNFEMTRWFRNMCVPLVLNLYRSTQDVWKSIYSLRRTKH